MKCFIICIAALLITVAESTKVRHVTVLHPTPIPLVGGETVPVAAYPFATSVRLNDQHNCGGTLISLTAVLTAKHCINPTYPLDLYKIVLGDHNSSELDGNEQVFGIKKYFYYLHFDVALVILSHPAIQSRYVQPVKLGHFPASGDDLTVTGWGLTLPDNRNSAATELQHLNLTVTSKNQCCRFVGVCWQRNLYFCIWRNKTVYTNICYGDSGSGVLKNIRSRFVLVGIAIGGSERCSNPKDYGIAIGITHAMRRWIKHTIVEEPLPATMQVPETCTVLPTNKLSTETTSSAKIFASGAITVSAFFNGAVINLHCFNTLSLVLYLASSAFGLW